MLKSNDSVQRVKGPISRLLRGGCFSKVRNKASRSDARWLAGRVWLVSRLREVHGQDMHRHTSNPSTCAPFHTPSHDCAGPRGLWRREKCDMASSRGAWQELVGHWSGAEGKSPPRVLAAP